MWGRYARRSDKQRIAEAFRIGNLDELVLEAAPSYNIAPTTNQPVIVADQTVRGRSGAVRRVGVTVAAVDTTR